MRTQGIVRCWDDDEGWGVIDSPRTPRGCWAHFSVVAVAGYRTLTPGAAVELEWEAAEQDGYLFRATRVWPLEAEPVQEPSSGTGTAGIYASTLTLSFGDTEPGGDSPPNA